MDEEDIEYAKGIIFIGCTISALVAVIILWNLL